jgi:catechol 2,3-dioxygenase-like lactoylglutathione lyase family enzyme
VSVICIEDIAFVRFSAPDLGVMRAFVEDFGLEPFTGSDGRLYGRAQDGGPFVHATERGEPGFRGVGLRAANVGDLETLAAATNTTVSDFTGPGGGRVVCLTDPDGFSVEVVAGQARAAPPGEGADPIRNSAHARGRVRRTVRLHAGPSHVYRLGHCVLAVTDFRTSERWYKDLFGLLTSDEIATGPKTAMGAFLRCDRGDIPTDHHTIFLAQIPGAPRFMHAAFEVENFDDLMLGHNHLKQQQHKPSWGIGRHILGSQIFDYWNDPWGHELEHWTDGDLFTAADPPSIATVEDLRGVQWGTPFSRGS